MHNQFRLSGNPMERRIGTKSPLKIFWLSVEGAVTEKQYFSGLSSCRRQLGINAVIDVETLERKRKMGDSTPEDVRELMDEFLATRSSSLEALLTAADPHFLSEYSVEELTQYFEGTLVKAKRKKMQRDLERLGINLKYLKYLRERSSEDDEFCLIIDRDQHSHTIESINTCRSWCEKRNVHFYFTNPCFEFWLLLHFLDVDSICTEEEKQDMLLNRKKSNRHSYVSKFLSDTITEITGNGQSKRVKMFEGLYMNRIDNAIENASKCATSFPELMDSLGCSIPQLVILLRSEYTHD